MIYKKNRNSKINWLNASRKTKLGYTFLNPKVVIKKNDYIKTVLGAEHLNSNIDQSSEPGRLEPLAIRLARANKKYKLPLPLTTHMDMLH